MQQSIPLSQLSPSPGNVRKQGGIPIYKLANSILAHGLLQNLVVTPAGDGFQVDGVTRLNFPLSMPRPPESGPSNPINQRDEE
jgi:ParB-like chromosome segregation protein Spo0J